MSSPIDERIVSMKFNNGQFLTGVAATLNALANLKKGLNLSGASKGVNDLSSSMAKLPPPQLAAGIQGISGKFAAMATVGVTALATVTSSALAAGGRILSALTIDPVKAGLEEYETNLGSIQTILANTGLEGEKGLGKVNKALDELNHYSDQTIYNFSEMAKNIGTFTAAGIDLETSAGAIKGIANLGAVSGSTAPQVSTAMYQISQALSAGKLSLEDWNSITNAGMGGKVLKDSLMETARVHGVAVDDIIKKAGSFRESLQEGWITTEILTETLSKFNGDLTKGQLKDMGYTEEQIKGIQKMAKTAVDAATKVKTMSQLIGTLQETAQSGWAKTWQSIFGDFNEAKVLFTDVNNVLGGMIGESADARNKLIGDWNKLGGRKVAIEAISNAFTALMAVVKPIKQAFRDVFPASTGKDLYGITVALRDFTETLKIGGVESKNLRRTFAGVFAIFSIVGQIVSGVIGVIARLFGVVGEGGDSFLNLTGNIGDFLVSVDEAMKKGEGLNRFFEGLGNVLEVPLRLLGALGALIAGAFTSFDEGTSDGIESALERIGARLEPFQAMADVVAAAWGRMGGVLKNVFAFMAPFAEGVANLFGSIGDAIASSVSDGDFSTVLDAVNTGLLGALVLSIRKFLSGGSLFDLGDSAGGFIDGVKEAFGGLNDTLGALQSNLKAGTLIKIAGAVALLTASVVALSLIDSAKLAKALAAITVMFAQLAGAMMLFEVATSTGGVLKLAPMAAGLILLSVAILVLSAAVKVLSTMTWEELLKGLGSLVVILGALSGTAKLMSGSAPGMISAGVGITAMSVGILILSTAVKSLSGLSWDEMIRGLTGLVVVMGAVAGAMRLMTGAIPGALAMLIVAPALMLLAQTLKVMASMSWEDFAKSMAVLAGGLLIIAGALYLMSAALPGAAAMLVVAPALMIMAGALKVMASMSWEDFGKSMAILGGALTILAITLTAMIIALPGAAALLVAAAALAVLAPVLMLFGAMSWEEIGKGLTMLAATLGIIGIAGLVLTPVIPTLLGLGAAILLIGVGTLAAGAGLLAFSLGLTALSVAGAVGVAAIVAIVSALIGLIPMAMNAVAEGIVLMANVIGGAGPQFVVAMTTLLTSMLTAINKTAPKIIDTIWDLVIKLANRVASGYPQLVSAGLRLITGVLNGIASNISGIVTAATSIIVNFINALSANLPRITDAGANMVITLVNSLAGSINSHAGEMQAAGRNLAFAIVDGMTGGLLSGASSVIGAAADMAGRALSAAKDVLGIASPSKEFAKIGRFAAWGFRRGLTGDRSEIKAAVQAMGGALDEAMKNASERVKTAEERYKKLTSARNKDTKAINRAREALLKARKEEGQARNARRFLRNELDDEHRRLNTLAGRYGQVERRLDAARKSLYDARKTRNDYMRSIKDSYSDLGQIEGTTLRGFTTSLKAQIKETVEFSGILQKLRKLGLNDDMYEELLAKGPDALPLARSILQGGRGGVGEINKLRNDLVRASGSLGHTASRELYQAGVDAAEGLVKGLERQERAISRIMDRIAYTMVRSIKKRLGIRSPSKEMEKVGGWSAEGLVKGLTKASSSVEKASGNMGDQAIRSLEKTMRKVGRTVDTGWDMTPVIRPVLDLTDVRKHVKTIPGLITSVSGIRIGIPIDALPTRRIGLPGKRHQPMPYFGDIADSTNRRNAPQTVVNMEQTINSPEPVSDVELYRHTKTMVSTVKGRLTP